MLLHAGKYTVCQATMENHPNCVLRDDILVSRWRQRRRRTQDHQSSSQVLYCLGDLVALQGWKLHVSVSEAWEHIQTHYWVTELFGWTVKSLVGGGVTLSVVCENSWPEEENGFVEVGLFYISDKQTKLFVIYIRGITVSKEPK